MPNILYCNKCSTYTLETICKNCKKSTSSKKPPRFSPEDHYGKYRRILKKQQKGE